MDGKEFVSTARTMGTTFYAPCVLSGRRILHIRRHTTDDTTPLSAYFDNGSQKFVTDQHIRDAVKRAATATALLYPATRGTPI